MTTPKINTIKRGDSRFYVNPETGAKTPGVTSIIGMLPKSFLRPWASKVVAEYALANLGEIVNIALRSDAQGAIDLLKRAPDRETQKAADIGTEVHDYFETLAKGDSVGRLHPELRPYVEHFDAFLQEFTPDFIFMEETVWSEQYDYAGSFDAFATIGGEAVWLDWKTTRSGIHPEVALQLAAYRNADYIIRPDGSRVPLPAGDGGAVLHVRPEGWSFVPVQTGPEVFDFFLHLRHVFRWEKEIKETVIGDPLNRSSLAAQGRRARRSA
ncbi:hypothetical protein [Krasilnikovia sp. MM14-A1259]|uniref:hypothetical protein n=1 Tax=Krasilnikovia sp. MM14-A1259 TaxID=3373539 RepID=UPI0038302E2A